MFTALNGTTPFTDLYTPSNAHLQLLPQEPRHLFSAVALGNNGKYNRLYTCTAQCDESDLAANRALLEAVVNSFKSEISAKA